MTHDGCNPEVLIHTPFHKESKQGTSLVFNDYLNFTQHPKIKATNIAGIQKYGIRAGASPLIGRHHEYYVTVKK